MFIRAVSSGLSLSQMALKMTPSRAQNMLIVIALVILKPMTKSIGAFIGSGFAGIAIYAPAIIAAYAKRIIAFFDSKMPSSDTRIQAQAR
jgi:hypothetical protein